MSSETPEFIAFVRINANGDDRICWHCERTFRSNRGLNQHFRSCKQNMIEYERIWSRKGKIRVHRNINKYNREYNNIELFTKTLHVGNSPSHVFEANVSTMYEQIVYGKRNLFLLPSGKAGKQYIDETTKLMNEWLQESPLKDIAFKAIMIMPNLLLQKPSKNSKAKDHLKALERRLESWISGDLLELSKEAETIQKRLRSKKHLQI